MLFVRQRGVLSLNTEVLSIGASIGAGNPTVIELTSDDGSPNPKTKTVYLSLQGELELTGRAKAAAPKAAHCNRPSGRSGTPDADDRAKQHAATWTLAWTWGRRRMQRLPSKHDRSRLIAIDRDWEDRMPRLREPAPGLLLAAPLVRAVAVAREATVFVYTSPNCGCYTQWIGPLEDDGFAVKAVDVADLGRVKSRSGITPEQASCRTTRVGSTERAPPVTFRHRRRATLLVTAAVVAALSACAGPRWMGSGPPRGAAGPMSGGPAGMMGGYGMGSYGSGMRGNGPGMRGYGGGMMGGSRLRHRQAMTEGIPAAYAQLHNPLPPSAGVIAAGEALYRTNCAACHGDFGEGNGPAAAGMSPPPANLRWSMRRPVAGDAYLMWTISEGGGQLGTAMPAFKETLTETDRWTLIRFLRAL